MRKSTKFLNLDTLDSKLVPAEYKSRADRCSQMLGDSVYVNVGRSEIKALY
jgi:hypothetical protein